MPLIKVVVDSRELRSGVVKMLDKQDIEIEITTLEVGDYIADNRIAFKRITIDDFLKSLFEDRRLFGQIKHLAGSYERPILIIEGEDPFFPGRTINPSFIQGFLKTIAVSFRVPTLYTLDEADTAEVISSIARAENDCLTQTE
ncbi:MAG TPA: ERCC4 domain-containing protein [Candidatus Limnocylindrales bacterium]|nr:ERCC4 domain-containing protein [Candidatus Limnocylindrales bacterium]